ncbi:MAG: winged helix-turn-helix transcriptional regulator [Methanobacteriota archaeon]|nr:MAG: winged helix-turn-helix transcriptional regulator [Euryarchaeota archaeon]
MAFELTVVSNTPLTPIKDKNEVAILFLNQIGYFPKGYDPKTDAKSIKESVPYRLLMECFFERMDKGWTVEQLSTKLKTTKPTIYRHINKLKGMDIIEDLEVKDGKERKKGYRIRYGNLAKAWNFVEAHVDVAMENYRQTVEHIQKLCEKKR